MMNVEDKKVCKIDNPLLENYTKRTRGGKTQIFYTGNDSRDFDRYRSEGGNAGSGATMHDKPDTLRIDPPEKNYYSELIEGEWWWINGCAECNGHPRSWSTYVECDEHNVCRRCSIPRKGIKGVVRGGQNGWICDACYEIEHNQEKNRALSAMPEQFDDYDYHDLHEIKCPYCDNEYFDSSDHSSAQDEEFECDRCDSKFTVTAEHTLTFNCDRIETPEDT